ncbi:MAG TPA: methyltransferase domain-containing protein [Longimicrobiales bacterium]|nr:methyltransferase domain-containing protein [Longimicrobiales bacterium]
MTREPTAAVRAAYDRLAGRYDRRWRRYLEASVRETLARTPVPADGRVLDAGCGTGLLLATLHAGAPHARLFGLDLSTAMLARARERLGTAAALVAGDVEAPPFRDAAFDLVVSTSSLHYWTRPERGLAAIHALLRPGGVLVLTDWAADYLACRILDRVLRRVDPAHRRVYGTAELAPLLDGAGFDVASLERYRIGWPWGLMTAVAVRRPA